MLRINRMFTMAETVKPKVPLETRDRDDDFVIRKRRLLHQSWKRATSENGMLLGSFAAKHLPTCERQEDLDMYEQLIGEADLDIFQWISNENSIPDRYSKCSLFKKIISHCRSVDFSYQSSQ